MRAEHWGVLAGVLSSLGLIISSLSGWDEALRPAFVGGAMGAVASVIVAIYSHPPSQDGSS